MMRSFIFFLLTKHSGDQIKKDEINGESGTYGEKTHTIERQICSDWMIILKWVLHN
jgi:hypothetical protein